MIYQETPIVTNSLQLFDLAESSGRADAGGGGGPPQRTQQTQQNSGMTGAAITYQDNGQLGEEEEGEGEELRYTVMWPSKEHFNEYLESGKKIFRGPYISVWNATQQREIYGTAWGMNTKTNLPVPVGSMEMQAGMPYFISPDAEGVVTWVGEVPDKVEFEFKILETPKGKLRENYISLPLNTVIRTAKDLCEDMGAYWTNQSGIMTRNDKIISWDVSTQNEEEFPSCGRIYDFNINISLEPGVPYLITVTHPGSWTQK